MDWKTLIVSVIGGIVSGAGLLLLQFYFLPKIEEKKLTNSSLYELKIDVYKRVLAVANKRYSGDDYSSDKQYINTILHDLYLVSPSIKIPDLFMKMISAKEITTVTVRGELINLIRSDLFGEVPILDPGEIPIAEIKKSQTK